MLAALYAKKQGVPHVYARIFECALLRVADRRDRTHSNVVRDLSCRIKPQRITVHCDVHMYPIPERDAALTKGNLLEHVFNRELAIIWAAG